jgi:Ca-activated chloride channel family protein
MFRFNDPGWLWALLLLPVMAALLWTAARRRRRALEIFADTDLAHKLTESVHVVARRWKAGLQLVGVALLAVALARPQFGSRVETVRSRGQDIVVAVDLSRSMLAEDVVPSRLDRARLSILRLMERLDGDRIGLVAFAADAFVQSPLTVDYSAAGMFLGAMHPDLMPVQGTDLGAALRVSLDALEQGGRDARVLILVTDAEDHEATYSEELARLREMGVALYVVAIGSSDGEPIPVFDEAGVRQGFLRDDEGNVVTTRVGDETLSALAREAGAGIVRVGPGGTGGAALDDFVGEIARGEGEEIDAMQVTRFEEQYQIFLGFALLLLFIDVLLPERRRTEHEWAGRFE